MEMFRFSFLGSTEVNFKLFVLVFITVCFLSISMKHNGFKMSYSIHFSLFHSITMQGRDTSEITMFNFTMSTHYDFNHATEENSRLCIKLTDQTFIIVTDTDEIMFQLSFSSFLVSPLHTYSP